MDDDDKNGGPNHLRAWREHRKMTQQQLADAVKTTQHQIAYLESGERALSAKWLRRLAPALKTRAGILLENNPGDVDFEVHDYFTNKLSKDQRRQLLAIAEALVKTGTSDE